MICVPEHLFPNNPRIQSVKGVKTDAKVDPKSLVRKELFVFMGLPRRALARKSHYWSVWSTESFRARPTQENQRNEHEREHQRRKRLGAAS